MGKTHSLIIFIGVSLAFVSRASASTINWSQPPVGCIEELLPRPEERPCLRLEGVARPLVDWPEEISPEEKFRWQTTWLQDLHLCRAKEILRREALNPGSTPAVTLQISWMRAGAEFEIHRKENALREASYLQGIPAQILLGALTQESLLANLGIADDGGNFSCGVGQINLPEWCRWISTQDLTFQLELGWPLELDCKRLRADHSRSLYEYGIQRLGGLPTYRLQTHHLEGVTLQDLDPALSTEIREAVRSFGNHCSDSRLGILAKAHELRLLFDRFVPEGQRLAFRYPDGEGFQRDCIGPRSSYFPLHTGWLLAVASYNAGPRARALSEFYWGGVLTDLTPLELIESLYWGGRFVSERNRVEFEDSKTGNTLQISWFKACVVQRHIARVIQYSTLPGHTIARSLETEGCRLNGVPPADRQGSSGRRDTPRSP